jgi:general secretion pathway protein F/type IV pilus assembly protein PilC
MPTFTYKARSSSGRVVSGVLTAEHQQAALRVLEDKALFPMSVMEGGRAGSRLLPGRRRRVRLRVVATFYSQLADLLRAGVPVLRALDVLSRGGANKVLAEVVREVRDDVANGESLADSMEKHPRIFPDLHVSMVRAAERGGFLEDAFSRIAIFTGRQDELRNKLLGSIVYPAVLVMFAIIVVVFLMSFVVPQVKPILSRMELPPLTILMFAISDFIKNQGLYVLVGLAAVVVAYVPYAQSDAGRAQMDAIKLKLPMLGKIITMVAVCRFCRILGTLLHNGVPILQSLRIAQDSAGNRVLSEAIAEATDSVSKGATLAEPLAASGMFPPDIVDMVAVAEESNNLDTVLVQVADSNEARTASLIDLAVRLLEPMLLLAMAVVVLFIAMSLLIPILTMGSVAG